MILPAVYSEQLQRRDCSSDVYWCRSAQEFKTGGTIAHHYARPRVSREPAFKEDS
jgi:hypothetical protein